MTAFAINAYYNSTRVNACQRFFEISCPSVDVVFLPRNLVDADRFQELHDVLPSEIVRRAVGVLRHQDDRHIGKENGNLLPEGCGPRRVLRDMGLDGDDGKGHALLDDDCSVNGHTDSPLRKAFKKIRIAPFYHFIIAHFLSK